MEKHKLTIIGCEDHDQQVIEVDGEQVTQNDYGSENVYRLAEHLGWEVEYKTLSGDEYEKEYA